MPLTCTLFLVMWISPQLKEKKKEVLRPKYLSIACSMHDSQRMVLSSQQRTGVYLQFPWWLTFWYSSKWAITRPWIFLTKINILLKFPEDSDSVFYWECEMCTASRKNAVIDKRLERSWVAFGFQLLVLSQQNYQLLSVLFIYGLWAKKHPTDFSGLRGSNEASCLRCGQRT